MYTKPFPERTVYSSTYPSSILEVSSQTKYEFYIFIETSQIVSGMWSLHQIYVIYNIFSDFFLKKGGNKLLFLNENKT